MVADQSAAEAIREIGITVEFKRSAGNALLALNTRRPDHRPPPGVFTSDQPAKHLGRHGLDICAFALESAADGGLGQRRGYGPIYSGNDLCGYAARAHYTRPGPYIKVGHAEFNHGGGTGHRWISLA